MLTQGSKGKPRGTGLPAVSPEPGTAPGVKPVAQSMFTEPPQHKNNRTIVFVILPLTFFSFPVFSLLVYVYDFTKLIALPTYKCTFQGKCDTLIKTYHSF